MGLLVKTEPTMTAEALAETRVEVKHHAALGFGVFFVFTIKRLEKWTIKNRNHLLYFFLLPMTRERTTQTLARASLSGLPPTSIFVLVGSMATPMAPRVKRRGDFSTNRVAP